MDTISHPNTTFISTLAAVQDAALASPLSIGLAVLLALVPLASLYRRRSGMCILSDGRGEREITRAAGGRSKANNYGYGRVEVTKLLVHPIKVCRQSPIVL